MELFDFAKPKFLSLPKERQHKKLALLLKSVYLERIGGKDPSPVLHLYKKYAAWIAFDPLPLNTLKEVSDAFHTHARLAALSLREDSLLPSPKTQDSSRQKALLPFHVYLDNLRSAFNVGSIIRTAECFGFSKVFFSKDTPNHLSPKVQKSAMGTDTWIDCLIDPPVEAIPRPLIILETIEETPSIFDFQFPPSFTLVLGNEEYGVSDPLLKEADHFVKIPLRGNKMSLNVANAFAIAAALATKN